MINKNLLRFVLSIFVLSVTFIGNLKAQTITSTVFSDDFNRGSGTTSAFSNGGTPSMTYTQATTSTGTGSGAVARFNQISGSDYAMQIVAGDNNATTTNQTAGYSYVTGPLSTFSAPFNTTLNSNPGPITWTFNLKTNRSTYPLSAFGSGSYGGAIMLAGTSSNMGASGANGYAILFAKGITDANNNTVRLIKFIGGIAGGASTGGASATTTKVLIEPASVWTATQKASWARVKVVYTPSTNTWELFTKCDSTSANPVTDFSSNMDSRGTNVDTSYLRNTPMTHFGFLWNHSSTGSYTSQTVSYDNFGLTVASTNPTLSSPTVSSITSTSAVLGATVTTGAPATLISRGTVYKSSSGASFSDNPLAEGGTASGTFTHTRSGLLPQTLYYFAGYANNVSNSSTYTNLSTESSFRTLSSPPTTQASVMSGSAVSSSQIDLSWTSAAFPSSGATVKQYLLLSAIAPATPTFTASNGSAPTVGSGTTIVSSSVSSSSTSYSVTGLTLSTPYNFLLIPYTYDGTNNSTYNYLTESAPTASATTSAGAAPVLSSPTATSITNSSAILGATIDNDGGSSLTSRGTVFSTISPVTIANNLLSEGGTSTGTFSHSRTGLSPETQYHYKGYAINSAATGLSIESSFRTLSNPPTSAASSLSAVATSGEQINVTWSGASFPSSGATAKGYVILRAAYPSVPSLSNSNGQSPTASAGSTIVSSSIDGNATSASATGLNATTRYNFMIIPYTWDGTNASTYNYFLTNAPSADATTLSGTPSAQPTSLGINSVTCNGMTLGWTAASGSPSGYLVLQSSGATAPNTNPANGSSYTIGVSLGNATVVYSGSATSLSLSTLTDNTNYNFKIYSYNGSGSNISYLTVSPLSGSQSTVTAATPSANAASDVYSNEFIANWSSVSLCATGNYLLDVATTSTFTANGVIASEDFENSLSLMTQSGSATGLFKSGNLTASNDRPLSAPYASKGTYGFSVNGSTSGVVTSDINTIGYANLEMSFKLSALSLAASTGGLDAADSVTVSVSPDGGSTWYPTVKVNGNTSTGNSVWTYSESGIASTSYDGNLTPVLFTASSTGGVTDGTGYGTVKITGLPNSSNLRINISMKASGANEYWVIDDFKVTGEASGFSILPNYNGLSVTGINKNVTGLSAGTAYYYRVRTAGNNGNSSNSNVITVNTTAASAPTLNGLTVSSVTHNSATIGATVTSAGSTSSISARGSVYKTSAGVTASDNSSAEGGTTVSSFTQSRTGLSPQTQYYYAAYATNASATGLSSESNFYTLSNPVTSQLSSLTATAVSGAQIDLGWIAASFPSSGASSSGYVVLRALYPSIPSLSNSNGQSPVAASGTTLVTSSLAATATSYSALSLNGLTRYNFAVIPYTWDGVNTATFNYLTSDVPFADATTPEPLATLPTAQPTNLSFSGIGCNSMTLSWTAATGSPDGYIVLKSSGSTAPDSDPTPSTSYSIGAPIGNAVVDYIGGSNSYSTSSLSDNSNYNFKIYSYNGSGSLINYLTISPLSGNSSSAQISAPSATSASQETTSSFRANWNASECATGYLLYVSNVDSFSTTSNVAQWSEFFNNNPNSDVANSNSLNQSRAISVSPSSTLSYLVGYTGSSPDTAVGTNGWNTVGKAWVVEVNTTGYSNLKVSSAQKSSASGPRNFRLEYKIGSGGTWTAVSGGSLQSNSTDWSTGTLIDVPLPSECDNQTSIFLRWITTDVTYRGDGTTTGVSSGGTNRIDNISVKGTTGSYVQGYDGLAVNGTYQTVSGLSDNTYYYYRVKAVAPNSLSAYSNTATALTLADPSTANYFTKASGDFNDPSIWEYAVGSGYVSATTAPSSTNNITIRQADSVKLTSDFTVGTGKTIRVFGKLDPDASVISGSGSFIVDTTGTFYCAHQGGLSGNITTTTFSFSTKANYVFDGTLAQSSAGLPNTSSANIVISNAAGVTWDASKIINAPGSLTINSGAMLSFGIPTVPYSVTGTGNFTAKTGSTLVITSSAGISLSGTNSGSMRLTGTRTFENNVNYNFSKDDLSANQLKSYLGSAFGTEITSIQNLTINNARGVADTISGSPSVTVNGNLNFVSGCFYKKSNKIILSPGASVTGISNGWVLGTLEKTVPTGSASVIFELGTDSLNYTPVTTVFNNVSTGGTLSATTISGAHPNANTSNISNTNRLNYYTVISNSGVDFDHCNANFEFTANSVSGTLPANEFVARSYSGSSWSSPTLGNRTTTGIQLTGLTQFGEFLMGASCSSTSTETITACDSYTWHGNIYTSSNNSATWTGTNSAGCDSVVTLNLTIIQSTANSTNVAACESYTWSVNGTTYTQSGTYSSVSGCHTEYLNLSINQNTSNTSTASACSSYTWSVNGTTYTQSGTYSSVSGCHTEYLNLSITGNTSNTSSVTTCGSYTWFVNGATYTQSGTYTSVSGCNTEYLNLTINQGSAALFTVHPSRTTQKMTVNFIPQAYTVVPAGSGTYTYQWYRNNTDSNIGGTLIPGATSASYLPSTGTASTNYYYCVITNEVGCSGASNPSGFLTVCAP